MDIWNFRIKARNFSEGFKKEFLKNPIGISIAIIVIFAILFAFGYVTIQYYERRNNSKYTVGTTIRIRDAGSVGKEVEYVYTVNKKEYYSFRGFSYGQNIIVPGGKYFVLYSSKKPENSEMFLTLVPDSLKIPPEDGWVKLPIRLK